MLVKMSLIQLNYFNLAKNKFDLIESNFIQINISLIN